MRLEDLGEARTGLADGIGSDDMAEVRRAFVEVILLSPACASFDQFSDYEARGDSFRQIVAGLTGTEMNVAEFAGRSAA